MQLSAPASAPISDAFLPVATADVASDASPEGEATAVDFGALFAGLTRAASAAPGTRAQPPIAAPSTEKPVSKLQLQSEEAAKAAAMVAFIVPTESAPPPVAIVGLPVGEPATPIDDERVSSGEDTEAITASLHADVMPLTATSGVPGAARGPQNAPAATGKRGDAFPSAPDRASPAATPPSPATAVVATVADKAGSASLPPELAPVGSQADPKSAAVALSASPAEIRRLAAGVPLTADPALRGLPRGQEMRTGVVADPSAKTAAKIAAAGPRAPATSAVEPASAEKNFLNVEPEDLTKPEANVGTGIALRESAMTTSAPASASPAIASVAVATRELGFDLGAPPSVETKVSVPEPIERLAHRAVEAVTETIERGASQTPSSVNLKFSVQGADLMVRVALRAEEVQVTFRTDSEDLRNALAQEWQLVRGRDADGLLQSVTPVFTAGDSGHPTSQQHSGGRDQAATFAHLQAQADAQSQRQFSRQAPSAPIPPAAGAALSAGVPASVSRPLSGDATGAARLLHTFA